MKKLLSYSLLAAAAAAGVSSADTATTPPVGYISLGSTTGVAVPANTDVRISVPLLKSAVYTGTTSTVDTGTNTITFNGTPAFAVNGYTATPHVILVESGAKSGLIAPVTQNTANSVTVAPGFFSLNGIVATDSISIRPAWTIASLMSGASSLTGVQLLSFSNTQTGTNTSSDALYFYVGSAWENGDGEPANNEILYPGEGFIVRTAATPINTFVVAGEVPKAKSYIAIGQATNTRDTVFSYISPTAETLQDSGLGFANGDILIDYNNNTTGRNKSGVPYFFVGGAWENADGEPAGNFQLIGGKSYVYRRAATASTGYATSQDTQTYIPNIQ